MWIGILLIPRWQQATDLVLQSSAARHLRLLRFDHSDQEHRRLILSISIGTSAYQPRRLPISWRKRGEFAKLLMLYSMMLLVARNTRR